MNLLRPRFAHHANDLLGSCPAHNRIVDQDDAFILNQMTNGVEFYAYPKAANRLLGFDKCAPDVVIADQSETKRKPAFRRIADRRRHA